MPVLSPTITVQDGFGSCRRVPTWSTATSRLATACSPRLHSSALLATATASTAATPWRRLFSGAAFCEEAAVLQQQGHRLRLEPGHPLHCQLQIKKHTSAHHPNNSQIKMLKPSAAHCWSSVWFPLIFPSTT